MVKTEAYTFPKPWPDKPECAGSSPVGGIDLTMRCKFNLMDTNRINISQISKAPCKTGAFALI